MKKKQPQITPNSSSSPLHVWAERRSEPEWDRVVQVLVATVMRRTEEEDAKEDRE